MDTPIAADLLRTPVNRIDYVLAALPSSKALIKIQGVISQEEPAQTNHGRRASAR